MKMKRVKVLALAMVLVMTVSLFAGCGAKKGETEADGAKSAGKQTETSKEENITINVQLWCPDFPEEAEMIMEAFEKENPNIKVDFLSMAQDSITTLTPLIASNSMPDLFSADTDPYMIKLADSGYLLDLKNTRAWENMLDSLKEQWTSKTGIAYGITGGLASCLMYYNMDQFEEAGITTPPENWEEFLEVCKKLKDAGYTPLIYPGGDPWTPLNAQFSYGLAQNLVGKDPDYRKKIDEGTMNYNTPGMADVFAKIRALPEAGYTQEGFMSTGYDDSTQLFIQGKGAMIFQGTWLTSQLVEHGNFNVGVFLPPWNNKGETKVPVVSSETGFAVSAKSDEAHRDAALKLLDYITVGPGFNMYQNKRMCIPGFKSETIQGEIKLAPQVMEVMDEISKYKVTAPFSWAYLPPVAGGEAAQKLVQEVAMGTKTPQQAAEDFDRMIKESANE